MTILTDLQEFVEQHRGWGTLSGYATKPTGNDYLRTVAPAVSRYVCSRHTPSRPRG